MGRFAVNLLLSAMFGALFGLGLLLIVAGLRGRRYLPSGRRMLGTQVDREILLVTMAVALLAGVTILLLTGWPVAAAGAAASVIALRRGVGLSRDHDHYVTRTNAVASWAELIRDNMAGAAGLEQALQASIAVAPVPIAPELRRFGLSLERRSLVDSLHRLGIDLDHPSADLIIAALSNAALMEVRELGPLLGRLADATRADTRMRERVEVGRARIRISARIVVATTALTIALLWVFARNLLVAYDSLAGQLWMCVVGSIFVIGGLALRSYSRFELPQRFRARQLDPGQPLPPTPRAAA